jgi:hypothetical protein
LIEEKKRLTCKPKTARLGLGLAALGRPGYVTLNYASDLGGQYEPPIMELRAHNVLDQSSTPEFAISIQRTRMPLQKHGSTRHYQLA